MVLANLLVGLHMAMTHAITQSLCASYVPGEIAGTGFSLADLVLGGFLFAGNLIAGRLADMTEVAGYGTTGCFMVRGKTVGKEEEEGR